MSDSITTTTDPRPALDRAVETAGRLAASVPRADYALPTTCTPMDVGALVAHLVAVLDRVEAIGRDGEVGELPDAVDVSPEELPDRWRAGADRVHAAWADDTTLDRIVRVPWDTMPGRDAVAIYVNELVVHTWDLARATGRDVGWDDEVIAVSDGAIHAQLPDAVRAPMWAAFAEAMGEEFDPPFADAVPVGDDATAVDRLVAWNGRTP